jgi:hypothetical protein
MRKEGIKTVASHFSASNLEFEIVRVMLRNFKMQALLSFKSLQIQTGDLVIHCSPVLLLLSIVFIILKCRAAVSCNIANLT